MRREGTKRNSLNLPDFPRDRAMAAQILHKGNVRGGAESGFMWH